jgi:hypothetical protein
MVAAAMILSGLARAQAPCAMVPEGGLTLAKGRRYPLVEIGKSGAIVVHQTVHQSRSVVDPPDRRGKGWSQYEGGKGDGPDCEWGDGAVALPLPFGKAQKVLVGVDAGTGCVGDIPDPLRLVRVGDEPALVQCSYPVNLAWGCSVMIGTGSEKGRSFGLAKSTNDVAVASGYAARDGVVFGVAVTRMRNIVGFVAPAAGPARKELLETLPEGFEPAGATVRVEPRGASEALVTIVPELGKALQLTMNGGGARVGKMKQIAAPPPAGMRLAVERKGKGAPRIVGANGGGAMAPVAGLDAAAATFSPAVAEAAGGWILAWSEGLGKTTRIRLARFDPKGWTIVGPIAQVSAGTDESGFVSAAGQGERAVLAWDEKVGKEWEVRAAEVRCPR